MFLLIEDNMHEWKLSTNERLFKLQKPFHLTIKLSFGNDKVFFDLVPRLTYIIFDINCIDSNNLHSNLKETSSMEFGGMNASIWNIDLCGLLISFSGECKFLLLLKNKQLFESEIHNSSLSKF
jgi:hypothetical protein